MSRKAGKRGATTEQLRDDIDHGRTADKVPASDPAAAPLGTDEEAAGTPVDPRLVAKARAAESSRQPSQDRGEEGKHRTKWTVAIVVIVVLAIAGAVLFSV